MFSLLLACCLLYFLLLLFHVFCCCCYYSDLLVYPATIQISVCYALVSYGAQLVLFNIYHMYSCLLLMNFVILCVTVYFTMFCEILLTGYQLIGELCESQ